MGFPTKGSSLSNMTGKSKVIKSSSSIPGKASGGSGHMFGKDSAGPVTPGVSMGATKGGGRYAAGGSGSMFGKQTVKPSKKL